MSLDTITLQCYLAVAETQSFTKAALRVSRTQSAISQQIAKLEHLLEKQLIKRGKRLSLTSDGEIFLGYAKKIYELHREALDLFKQPELKGEIKFGLPEDFATMILSEVLVDFTRLHPRIILNVECDLTMNLISNFEKEKFDLILTKTNKPDTIEKGIDVWDDSVDWIGKKELLPKLTKDMSIPLVLSPFPCIYRENVINTLDKMKLNWRIVYSSTSYAGTMAAVRAGLGITVIQRSLIPSYLDKMDYSFLPKLNDIHVSLFKKNKDNKIVSSLEYFILKKLKH